MVDQHFNHSLFSIWQSLLFSFITFQIMFRGCMLNILYKIRTINYAIIMSTNYSFVFYVSPYYVIVPHIYVIVCPLRSSSIIIFLLNLGVVVTISIVLHLHWIWLFLFLNIVKEDDDNYNELFCNYNGSFCKTMMTITIVIIVMHFHCMHVYNMQWGAEQFIIIVITLFNYI